MQQRNNVRKLSEDFIDFFKFEDATDPNRHSTRSISTKMTFFIPATVKFLLFHAQWSTLILAFVMILVMCYYFRPEVKPGQAPGPRPWPILGSLHLMAGYKVPYAAFTALKVRNLAAFWCIQFFKLVNSDISGRTVCEYAIDLLSRNIKTLKVLKTPFNNGFTIKDI